MILTPRKVQNLQTWVYRSFLYAIDPYTQYIEEAILPSVVFVEILETCFDLSFQLYCVSSIR
jgi:hypothetical protein